MITQSCVPLRNRTTICNKSRYIAVYKDQYNCFLNPNNLSQWFIAATTLLNCRHFKSCFLLPFFFIHHLQESTFNQRDCSYKTNLYYILYMEYVYPLTLLNILHWRYLFNILSKCITLKMYPLNLLNVPYNSSLCTLKIFTKY